MVQNLDPPNAGATEAENVDCLGGAKDCAFMVFRQAAPHAPDRYFYSYFPRDIRISAFGAVLVVFLF